MGFTPQVAFVVSAGLNHDHNHDHHRGHARTGRGDLAPGEEAGPAARSGHRHGAACGAEVAERPGGWAVQLGEASFCWRNEA